MKRHFLMLCTNLLVFSNAFSQAPDHAWLETSHLKVRVNADGRLFCDDEKGAFLVPHGDSMVSLMRGASLWFGGIDPANNLKISAQTEHPEKTDFKAGFRGIPNSGRVWKVTREEIHAHWEDYLDNWIVDNPNPAIFGWPARKNQYFRTFNGFSLPDSMARLPVWTKDYPNYQPDKGDSPIALGRLNHNWYLPSQMACFAFHSDAQHFSGFRSFPVQVWGQVFVYDCPESELLSRSVFVRYFWERVGDVWADSCVVSAYNDVTWGIRWMITTVICQTVAHISFTMPIAWTMFGVQKPRFLL